ncbi:hypothetical protein GF402_06980 [Candidatus Fermentibacteria bacterium]|nr:hypothetical protein [Candidatus Fermentibacteria bacterium]
MPPLLEVTSPDNPRIKRARSLSSPRMVKKHRLYLLEGPRFISDLPPDAAANYLVLSRGATPIAEKVASRAAKAGVDVLDVPEEVFASISDTTTSQGLAAVCPIPRTSVRQACSGRLVLVLDGVSDPGNVGTSIRSAAAFGCGGVLLGKGCASAYSTKAVRASAGTVAVTKICESLDLPEAVDSVLAESYLLLGADVSGDYSPPSKKSEKVVLFVGSESHGLSREVRSRMDHLVGIPISDRVESLNAAVSASILLHALRGRS